MLSERYVAKLTPNQLSVCYCQHVTVINELMKHALASDDNCSLLVNLLTYREYLIARRSKVS